MLEAIPGRCTMPWAVFAGLAKVRALAPKPADLEDLRLTLRQAGLIAGDAVDVEKAGLVVMRWDRAQREAAMPPRLLPPAQPRRGRTRRRMPDWVGSTQEQPQRRPRRRRSQPAGAIGYYNPLTGMHWNPATGEWQ